MTEELYAIPVIFAIGVLLYGIVAVGMFIFQRHIVYRPEGVPAPPEANDVPEIREVLFRTTDGLALAAWWAPPASVGAPTVLLLHGNSGNRAWTARKIRVYLDAGYGIFAPDYRGFGGNPGSPSEAGLQNDALAARAFIVREGIDESALFYHGESLGSGVANWLAAQHPPRGLILDAAFSSLADAAQEMYPWLPVRPIIWDRFPSVEYLRTHQSPLLILHGEKDDTISYEHSERLLAAHSGPKQRVAFPEGSHNDLYDYGAGAIVVSWIHDQMYNSTEGGPAAVHMSAPLVKGEPPSPAS